MAIGKRRSGRSPGKGHGGFVAAGGGIHHAVVSEIDGMGCRGNLCVVRSNIIPSNVVVARGPGFRPCLHLYRPHDLQTVEHRVAVQAGFPPGRLRSAV